MVVTPRRRRHFAISSSCGSSEKRILLIIVSPEGDVQNRILLTDRAYSPSELIEAANILNQHYAG